MIRETPLWIPLAAGPKFWIVRGPDTGLIQVLAPAGDGCLGAFAFEVCADLRERLVDSLRPFVAATGARPRLKIVTDSRLVVTARAAATELGFTIEKIVERSGDYEIRFEPDSARLQVSALEKSVSLSGRPRIRVMVIDDSPVICTILSEIFGNDKDLELVGSVEHPRDVVAAIERFRPDVVTLDIHMPEMTGVEVLRRFIQPRGIPAIMFTSISPEEGPLVLNALEAGAVDYIQKPSSQEVAALTPVILAKVKTAAKIVPRALLAENCPKVNVRPGSIDSSRLIAIGASTGGTKAITEILVRLPKDVPPILVAQHIPAGFSKAFADRLNSLCDFEVTEAKDGDLVRPGRVLIAPGGKQMRLVRSGGGLAVSVTEALPSEIHKPSVDVLFESVQQSCGPEAVAVLLTGMGSDGAKGMLALHNLGCATVAQDETSCVVYGMPQAARQLGGVAKTVPLLEIAQELADEVSGKSNERKKKPA